MTADGLIRVAEVATLTGLSKSTIYRLMKVNKFPSPSRISTRIISWKRAEVEAWLANPGEKTSAA